MQGNIEEQRPFRVLSLDGGGMRGMYSITVLHTLSERFARENGFSNVDLGAAFDLIVGTSTGGIIACGLAAGIPTSRIVSFYRDHGPKIFTDPTPTRSVGVLLWILRHLFRPGNPNVHLRTALEEVFGSLTMGQLYEERKIGLCIPAVHLATQGGWIFKTPHNPAKQRDNNFTIVDVCLATSAAPMILPEAAIRDPDDQFSSYTFVDGGLWANNPVLIGLLEAVSSTSLGRKIEIISVGSCPPPAGHQVSSSKGRRGIVYWRAGIKALATALDAQAAAYTDMSQLLAGHLDRPCSIVRLPQSSLSAEQARHVALDRPTPEALEILSSLGKHDGNMVHSAILRGEPSMVPVGEIFKSVGSTQSNMKQT